MLHLLGRVRNRAKTIPNKWLPTPHYIINQPSSPIVVLHKPLKLQWCKNKTAKKKKKLKFFWNFLANFCLGNYVSVSLRDNGCIAPKLRTTKNRGSKTLRGKSCRLQGSAGQGLKANLSCGVMEPLLNLEI